MMKFSIIDPYNQNRVISAIPYPHPAISEATLSFDFNTPALLRMVINSDYPFWYVFKDNPNLGLLLERNNLRFAFVPNRQAQFITGLGAITLTFNSAINLLDTATPRVYPIFKAYKERDVFSLAEMLPNTTIQSIGKSKNVNINAGTLNNLEFLTEIVGNASMRWVDGGIDQFNNYIIRIGNFNENPITAKIQGFFVPETPTPTSTPKTNLNGQYFSHLLAVGSSSGGADGESNYLLDNPRADYIDPDFPLVDIGTKDKDGNVVYYIEHSQQYRKYGFYSFKQWEYTQSPNSNQTDEQLQETQIDLEKARKTLYQKAVSYLKGQNYGQSISLSLSPDDIYLPGTRFELDLQIDIDTQQGLITPFVAKEPYIIKNIEYNLENYV